MLVSFNRSPKTGPWGGGSSFVSNMSNFLTEKGHDVIYSLTPDVDLIFMIDPRPNDSGYSASDIQRFKNYFPDVKVIHRINECDKRKNTDFIDEEIIKSNKVADETVFISKWLQSYFEDKGFCPGSYVSYNGVDSNIFYDHKRGTIKSKPRLVTHHWSDNWMKGFDIYKQIDQYLQSNDWFEFTYVGRYNSSYKPTRTKIIEPLSGKALGDELRNHDIYVTASRFEPCGMHHIEGSACGLPILFHADGGGINELCKNHGISFSSFEEFLKSFDAVIDDYSLYREKINYDSISSAACCKRYYEIIEGMF